MRSRLTVGLLVVILGFYCWLLITKGLGVMEEGGIVPVVFGLGLIIAALLGVYVTVRELQFGRRTAQLDETLAAEGIDSGLGDLPRRPSGRVDRAAADSVFEQRRAEVEASPDDWRPWFRLAVVYDAAGDRRRGREAARHAIELYNAQG